MPSNTASLVVSRHQGAAGWDYRVQLADGTMQLMSEHSLRCLVCGDIALKQFDPHESFDGFPPPRDCIEGPRAGDVIRVQIEAQWHVCTILELDASPRKPRRV